MLHPKLPGTLFHIHLESGVLRAFNHPQWCYKLYLSAHVSLLMRVFIGIPLSENLKDAVAGLQHELEQCVKMKAVERENLHWTVKFIGDKNQSQIGAIKSALDTLKSSLNPFSVTLFGAGVFPATVQRPNVMWVGARDEPAFRALLEEVDVALSKIGVAQEKRGYTPHLTIGRIKTITDEAAFKKFLDFNKSREFGKMVIDHLVLYESVLDPSGPAYSKLHEAKLGVRHE